MHFQILRTAAGIASRVFQKHPDLVSQVAKRLGVKANTEKILATMTEGVAAAALVLEYFVRVGASTEEPGQADQILSVARELAAADPTAHQILLSLDFVADEPVSASPGIDLTKFAAEFDDITCALRFFGNVKNLMAIRRALAYNDDMYRNYAMTASMQRHVVHYGSTLR